jgi:hypothetical protein
MRTDLSRRPCERRGFPRSAASLLAAVILGLAGSPAVRADDEALVAPEEVRPGWEPSLAIAFGLQIQELDGSFDADFTVESGGTIDLPRGDTNDLTGQHFSPKIALDTPPLYVGGLQPRLFFHAGGQIPLANEHTARRSVESYAGGSPDLDDNCLGPNPRLCIVRAKNRLFVNGGWYTGLGVDLRLPIEILDKRIVHWRTSLDYFGQSWDARTFVDRLSVTNPPGMPLTEVQQKVRSSSDEKIVHGLGPRFELALHLAEQGPFRMDMFFDGQLYWLLSDTDVRYTGSNADGNTTARTEVDSFIAQFGGGIRVVWKGN